MHGLHLVSLLPLAAAAQSKTKAQPLKRVAIIGAGAGGSSAAYHLTQYAADASIPTDIDVFERNSYIGGRTTTVNIWDDPNNPVELGGSIFVEVNHIMVEAVKKFNLSAADQNLATRLEIPDLGIWNGKEFILVTRAEDTWWDKAKLLWRYGTAPLWTNRLMKSAVGKFLTMYDEPIFPWSSLSDVIEQVGLLEVTGVTGEQYLKANGIGELFAKEIIQASTRVNYASNLPYIHGLETMVCMATNGAMQIEGGNWQIFYNMLVFSNAVTYLNTTISDISKQKDGTFILKQKDGSSELKTRSGATSTYDEIILAAPLQYSGLAIDPPLASVPDEIPYAKLYVTLFASPHKLDPKAFNLDSSKLVPQYVLTTLPSEEDAVDAVGSPGFFSISISDQSVNPLTNPPRPEYIYKIFSPARVNSTFLSHILGHEVTEKESEHGDVDGVVSWIHHKIWHSYPREYPRVTFESIKLDEGFWYTSGIESFISTMETSALSGKNVAKLIVNEWAAKKGEAEVEAEHEQAGIQQVLLQEEL